MNNPKLHEDVPGPDALPVEPPNGGAQRALRVVPAQRITVPTHVRPYDLRHTRVTRWVGAGHNLAIVKKAAGHSTINTTMIYAHLADEVLKTLAEKAEETTEMEALCAG